MQPAKFTVTGRMRLAGHVQSALPFFMRLWRQLSALGDRMMQPEAKMQNGKTLPHDAQ
jgi:hypothetical protein